MLLSNAVIFLLTFVYPHTGFPMPVIIVRIAESSWNVKSNVTPQSVIVIGVLKHTVPFNLFTERILHLPFLSCNKKESYEFGKGILIVVLILVGETKAIILVITKRILHQ